MKRPGGFTFVALLLTALSLVGLYSAFTYGTGREGRIQRLPVEDPLLPVWPFTLPVRFEPTPPVAVCAALYGVLGLATAAAVWRVSRLAFPLAIAWCATFLPFLVVQQICLEVYQHGWMIAVTLLALTSFALWLCTYIRQVLTVAYKNADARPFLESDEE